MLSKQHRLRRDTDFTKVFKKGKNSSGSLMRLKFAKNTLAVTRFAVVVSTKVSKKAVKRNELRRRVQEVLRLHLLEVVPSHDVVVMMQPAALSASYAVLEKEIMSLLKKAKITV